MFVNGGKDCGYSNASEITEMTKLKKSLLKSLSDRVIDNLMLNLWNLRNKLMKNMILRFTVFFLFMAPKVFADWTVLPASTISSLGTGWGGEGLYINLASGKPVSANGMTCGPALILLNNAPMQKEMLAILLSAYHAGSQVAISVNLKAPCNANGGVILVASVSIQK